MTLWHRVLLYGLWFCIVFLEQGTNVVVLYLYSFSLLFSILNLWIEQRNSKNWPTFYIIFHFIVKSLQLQERVSYNTSFKRRTRTRKTTFIMVTRPTQDVIIGHRRADWKRNRGWKALPDGNKPHSHPVTFPNINIASLCKFRRYFIINVVCKKSHGALPFSKCVFFEYQVH